VIADLGAVCVATTRREPSSNRKAAMYSQYPHQRIVDDAEFLFVQAANLQTQPQP
jgi:hypothetical protein